MPASWFPAEPDPDVVYAARADFGTAIFIEDQSVKRSTANVTDDPETGRATFVKT